jgi:DNA primase
MDVERILVQNGIEYFESAGKRFVVTCPFHDDHNPSAGIWKDGGFFSCFACHHEASFEEYLSAELGITESDARRITRGEDDVRLLEKRLMDYLEDDRKEFKHFSVKSFHQAYPRLVEGSAEWKYVIRRGISDESIRLFDLRIGRKKYRGRVILPIYSPEGKLVSYAGRAVKVAGTKTLKARSPHRTFYGIRELICRTGATKFDELVIVEGEFDAMYLQQFGVPAVSNMGTVPFSPEKILLLKRYAKKVVLNYDSDEAGFKGMYGYLSKDGKKKMGQFEKIVGIIPAETMVLPEGRDPNELTPSEVRKYYGKWAGGRDDV